MTVHTAHTALGILPIDQAVITVLDAIADTLPTFAKTCYPLDYASEFVRAHPQVIGIDPVNTGLSRPEAAGLITEYVERTGQNRGAVCIALADGYLAEHHIEASNKAKIGALTLARQTSPRLLGVSEHPTA